MDRKLRDDWIAALRSGAYPQGRTALKTYDGGYCCLGVLCKVKDWSNENRARVMEGEYSLEIETKDDERVWNSSEVEFDSIALALFGLSYDNQAKLISMNDDDKLNFKQIANWIEENL